MSALHPIDLLREYINQSSTSNSHVENATNDALEFGLPVPDAATASLLTTLAATTQAKGVIAITPAASVVGLHFLQGMPEKGILSCIDPEPEHQRRAKEAFRDAGYSPSRVRFLPSRPLDVMGRLAENAYQIVYAEVPAIDFTTLVDAALPLLSPGGVIILPDALMDGTLQDLTRKDRETTAAREADEYFNTLEDVHVARLPLGSGLTLITKL